MINIAGIKYRVVAVTDSQQLDLTGVTHGLTWSEAAKEFSSKINLKLAIIDDLANKIQFGTQIIIYAGAEEFVEVIRGNVSKMQLVEQNQEFVLNIECKDECHQLRHNQSDLFFSEGHTSTAILEKVLEGTPHRIEIQDGKHAKKIYRGEYHSDMLTDVLKDLKEKTHRDYFIRAKEGVVEIIPRGTNEEIYHFDIDNNITKAEQSLDASKAASKVKILGKQNVEGKPAVESVVEGDSTFGGQIIYRKSDKETLAEAESAAKKLLDENGIKFETKLETADLPFLRKNDKIRIRSSVGEGYFFVKSIRHDATQQKMSLELDAEKGSYDIAETSESTDAKP